MYTGPSLLGLYKIDSFYVLMAAITSSLTSDTRDFHEVHVGTSSGYLGVELELVEGFYQATVTTDVLLLCAPQPSIAVSSVISCCSDDDRQPHLLENITKELSNLSGKMIGWVLRTFLKDW